MEDILILRDIIDRSLKQCKRRAMRGKRVVELLDDIDLPKDLEVMVVIPVQDDEREVNGQLQSASENETGNYARRVVFDNGWANGCGCVAFKGINSVINEARAANGQ